MNNRKSISIETHDPEPAHWGQVISGAIKRAYYEPGPGNIYIDAVEGLIYHPSLMQMIDSWALELEELIKYTPIGDRLAAVSKRIEPLVMDEVIEVFVLLADMLKDVFTQSFYTHFGDISGYNIMRALIHGEPLRLANGSMLPFDLTQNGEYKAAAGRALNQHIESKYSKYKSLSNRQISIGIHAYVWIEYMLERAMRVAGLYSIDFTEALKPVVSKANYMKFIPCISNYLTHGKPTPEESKTRPEETQPGFEDLKRVKIVNSDGKQSKFHDWELADVATYCHYMQSTGVIPRFRSDKEAKEYLDGNNYLKLNDKKPVVSGGRFNRDLKSFVDERNRLSHKTKISTALQRFERVKILLTKEAEAGALMELEADLLQVKRKASL